MIYPELEYALKTHKLPFLDARLAVSEALVPAELPHRCS